MRGFILPESEDAEVDAEVDADVIADGDAGDSSVRGRGVTWAHGIDGRKLSREARSRLALYKNSSSPSFAMSG